jgi:hypothetical protein
MAYAISAAADKIENYKLQTRVCFGEENPYTPNLIGMRVVEYYITADNIVPCHIYVASRQRFKCVFSREHGTVDIINNDGRSQEFFFIRLGPESTQFRLIRIRPDPCLQMRVDFYTNRNYNDTAFVFFGFPVHTHAQNTLMDKQVSSIFAYYRISRAV